MSEKAAFARELEAYLDSQVRAGFVEVREGVEGKEYRLTAAGRLRRAEKEAEIEATRH